MQLVIKIPEDVYTRLFDKGVQDNEIATDDICEMARALRLGTPLPKGHGALKDIGKLSYECMHENSSECNHLMCDTCQFNCVAKYEIEDAPTIIEADTEDEE